MTLELPHIENWDQLIHFAKGIKETGRFGGLSNHIIGAGVRSESILAYYRGYIFGLWIGTENFKFTPRDKRVILTTYATLRMER